MEKKTRKIRKDVKRWAPCGKTTERRCKRKTAELPECEDCRLVKRQYQDWKMINKKPYKRCPVCGEWKQTSDFYKRQMQKTRHVYTYFDTMCMVCKRAYQQQYRIRKKEESILNDSK